MQNQSRQENINKLNAKAKRFNSLAREFALNAGVSPAALQTSQLEEDLEGLFKNQNSLNAELLKAESEELPWPKGTLHNNIIQPVVRRHSKQGRQQRYVSPSLTPAYNRNQTTDINKLAVFMLLFLMLALYLFLSTNDKQNKITAPSFKP